MENKDLFEEANSSNFAVVSVNPKTQLITVEIKSKPSKKSFFRFSGKQNNTATKGSSSSSKVSTNTDVRKALKRNNKSIIESILKKKGSK